MMPAGESRTIVLWTIALFTLFGAVQCQICPVYEPFLCHCSHREPDQFKALKMCPYVQQGRVFCGPCPIYLQSHVNCSACPGNTCPVCSKYKFGWSLSSSPSARDDTLYTFSPYTGRAIVWNILRPQNETTSDADRKMGRSQSSKDAQGAYFRIRIVDDQGEMSSPRKLEDNNRQSDVGAGLHHSRSVDAQAMSVAETGKSNDYKHDNTPANSHALPPAPPKKSEGFKTISKTSGFKELGIKDFGPRITFLDPCGSRNFPESGRLYLRRSKFHPRERETILALLAETGVLPKPEDASSPEQLDEHFLLAYRVTNPYNLGMRIRHRNASNHVKETLLDFRFDPVFNVAAVCVNGKHVRSVAIDKRYRLPDLLQRLREHYQHVVSKEGGSGRVSGSRQTTRVGDKLETPKVRIKVVVMRVDPGLNRTAYVRGKMAEVMSESEAKNTEIHQGRPNKGIENEPLLIDKNEEDEGVVMHVTLKELRRNHRKASIVLQNSWCTISRKTRNGVLKCTIWSYKKFCTLICHEGCLFAGQPTVQVKCDRKNNIWEPALKSCQCGDDHPSGNELVEEELDYGVLPPGVDYLSDEDDYYYDENNRPSEELNYDGGESGALLSGEKDASNQEQKDDGKESGILPPEGEDLSSEEYYEDGEDPVP